MISVTVIVKDTETGLTLSQTASRDGSLNDMNNYEVVYKTTTDALELLHPVIYGIS